MTDVIRITTWNCRSGALGARLQDLEALKSDIAFVQECRPDTVLPLHGEVLQQNVGESKALALAAPTGRVQFERLVRPEAPVSSIAALATGPLPCLVLGLWTHPPDYRAEVDQILAAFGDLIATTPTVMLGDLNTGPKLGDPYIKGKEVFGRLNDLGLFSAYHAAQGIEHGYETHATYFHASGGNSPWHIDYCFMSQSLLSRVVSVEVGDGPVWEERSDHRPLTVTLSLHA